MLRISPTWWPEVAFTEMEKKEGADFREDQGLDLEHDRVGVRGRSYPSRNTELSSGCIRLVVRKDILVRGINLATVWK